MKSNRKWLQAGLGLLLIVSTMESNAQTAQSGTKKAAIFSNKAYTIFPDRVVQGGFEAKVISATELSSNYKSPVNKTVSPKIQFKFSINGNDNEMPIGKDHFFNCTNKQNETPVITFGKQYIDESQVPTNAQLAEGAKLKVKVDISDILQKLRTDGYYTFYNGDKLYKDDFKGVFIAGGTAPLTWDFANLRTHSDLQLQDPDGNGIYELDLVLNLPKDKKETAQAWKLSKVVSFYPQLKSDYLISEALYNMSLEEMVKAIEPDSTFRTGQEWAGVWTRDISYSIILSMAILQPRVAMFSLMRKVKDDKIVIQDTGTGGAYPVSSDRMVWALAAWEIYKSTGDKEWLRKAFAIVKNSVDDDINNLLDKETGLFRGESSFLDWREQTYPRWMQPADIFDSYSLGTNAVHYRTIQVLGIMAKSLGEQKENRYSELAEGIKKGINQYMWVPEKSYYGQFLYGRTHKILSKKSEALGEALCVIFGIAEGDRAKMVVEQTPVNQYGIPCIYPQIEGIAPYHNNAVWPFVQSYWALAAAKTGNEESFLQSLAAIYRPAALFLTNKENFVAENGDFAGTVINSSNMLWSLSGNIGIIYRGLFGINYEAERILFKPIIPKELKGNWELKGYKYRNAMLNIKISGYGSSISSILLNGKKLSTPEIPSNLVGSQNIEIVLKPKVGVATGKVNLAPLYTALETPIVKVSNDKISWEPVKGAKAYRVYCNGKSFSLTNETSYKIPTTSSVQLMVSAIDEKGYESFASEPVRHYVKTDELVHACTDFALPTTTPFNGALSTGVVEISKNQNTKLELNITVPASGKYALDFRYANGNGPVNTENKCAIRSLRMDNNLLGTFVFPQRGAGEWGNWGWSNAIVANLGKGQTLLTLSLEPSNENMNGAINQAVLDVFRIIRIE